MLAQGGEEKAPRTPKRLAAAGSKHPGPRAASLGAGGNRIKRRLATPLRNFRRPGSAGGRRGLADGTVRSG